MILRVIHPRTTIVALVTIEELCVEAWRHLRGERHEKVAVVIVRGNVGVCLGIGA